MAEDAKVLTYSGSSHLCSHSAEPAPWTSIRRDFMKCIVSSSGTYLHYVRPRLVRFSGFLWGFLRALRRITITRRTEWDYSELREVQIQISTDVFQHTFIHQTYRRELSRYHHIIFCTFPPHEAASLTSAEYQRSPLIDFDPPIPNTHLSTLTHQLIQVA